MKQTKDFVRGLALGVAVGLELWREAYGPDVARYVEVGVNQHWAGWRE